MDQEYIFKAIQKSVTNTPLILVGSGASAPHGLPSMSVLGQHLIDQLGDKYHGTPCWDIFEENIANDQDLERALTGIELTTEVLEDIKRETWNLISTNYDRLIEYACDLAEIPVMVGFNGQYLKRFSGSFSNKDAVNLLKVHGSLDVFRDTHGGVVSASMLSELPPGLVPELITPGSSKFAAILHGTPRELLLAADERIKQARSFLCIGYGFNDSQIQEGILTRIRSGIPLVSITQEVSDSAAHLLANNAQNYITIQQGPEPDKTEVCMNRWSILDH